MNNGWIEKLYRYMQIYFECLNVGAIGPRTGPGTGKKAGYGSGKQTLRLKANGTAAIEEVDNSRTLAEENINKLLETFMGINDNDLGDDYNSFTILLTYQKILFFSFR